MPPPWILAAIVVLATGIVAPVAGRAPRALAGSVTVAPHDGFSVLSSPLCPCSLNFTFTSSSGNASAAAFDLYILTHTQYGELIRFADEAVFLVLGPSAGSTASQDVVYRVSIRPTGTCIAAIAGIATLWLVIVVGVAGVCCGYSLYRRKHARPIAGQSSGESVNEASALVAGSGGTHAELGHKPHIDARVSIKTLVTRRPFPVPREPFATWCRHEHPYLWPFYPYADEPLVKSDRIMVTLTATAVNVLINTAWASGMTSDSSQSSFSTSASYPRVNLVHYLAILPLVVIAKSLTALAVYHLYLAAAWARARREAKSDGHDPPIVLGFSKAALITLAASVAVFGLLLFIYILIIVAMIHLAEDENCYQVVVGTLFGILLAEFLDITVVFAARAGALYKVLLMRGSGAE
ncbi:uncharacterized protein AMSG_06150 [Thecamonas trahens ATCC 50062]|uniref:Uncharacterized protein n=1 Tax=Thecamonas trahens ATCC 50062 TaxID=461836 RepID=A0A0L0DC95_THETB|nr:hypothetical protein AMSG_06150 [Thecamonas trahens ATCC 50062]KNC49860.1 hypothetical protein AMSG_06150 [Thecamonas trahens ATCC 50062]|eukprot:XP_013757344.1 hypothetical protein AMSG_06150 [Thecamonas trahens ATCC 50062]